MYLQLTEKCNMTCAHCCFAATTKGPSMTHEVFATALAMAESVSGLVTLGGGEPTVHPYFFDFLDKAIASYNRNLLEIPPLVITNGKLVSKARKLLQYVENEASVYVELSLDDYHDPIRPEIVAAFQAYERRRQQQRYGYTNQSYEGGAGVRTVKNILPVGRAADPARGLPISFKWSPCCCEDMLVDPLGNVFSCGCKTHLLGNIFEDWSIFADYDREHAHEGGSLPVREHARLPVVLAKAA